jgi:hypothetical protein
VHVSREREGSSSWRLGLPIENLECTGPQLDSKLTPSVQSPSVEPSLVASKSAQPPLSSSDSELSTAADSASYHNTFQAQGTVKRVPLLSNGLVSDPKYYNSNSFDFINNICRFYKRYGGYLEREDFQSLYGTSWLTNHIIEMYCHVKKVTTKEPVVILETATATNAINLNFKVTSQIYEFDFKSSSKILIPLFVEGNHWVLLVGNFLILFYLGLTTFSIVRSFRVG